MVWLAAAAALVCSPLAARAADEEKPEATPYRPTVSTPATLSAPGWLEGEFGGLDIDDRDHASGTPRRASIPYTFKYAFSEDWGIRVGGEAWVRAHRDDGSPENGIGDTSLVAKRRFAVDEASAFGLEIGLLAPTARRALQLGSGKPDWSANGIYSVDFAGWHADVNALETRMGAHDTGSSRWQSLAAAALSHPLGPRWTMAGEISATAQRGQAGAAQVLGAASYALHRDCVLDIGAARGLNRASPTWQTFTGVTVVIDKLD
jgi:hypothetical protein